MNTKTLLPVLALVVATSASANGGLGFYDIDQHKDNTGWVQENSTQPVIAVQGPLDAFNRAPVSGDRQMVDTEMLKQTYNGRS